MAGFYYFRSREGFYEVGIVTTPGMDSPRPDKISRLEMKSPYSVKIFATTVDGFAVSASRFRRRYGFSTELDSRRVKGIFITRMDSPMTGNIFISRRNFLHR